MLHYLPFFVAPIVWFLFSLISAYVFKFGVRRTGIHFDYVLFAIVVIIASVLGGVI